MASPSDFNLMDAMKQHLPQYIINCFLAAGYDTCGVIATMTVSSTPGNKDSIEEIQTYIVNECPDDLKYRHMENPAAGAAKFPPGHIILIKKFINYVKVQQTACPRKRKPESGTCTGVSKRSKVKRMSAPSTPLEDMYEYVCHNIVKWQRGQKPPLSTLVEHKHYEIDLKVISDNDIKSCIVCKPCGNTIQLQYRSEKSKELGELMISNWYRHVKECKNLHSKESNSVITSFFSCQSVNTKDHCIQNRDKESAEANTISDHSQAKEPVFR